MYADRHKKTNPKSIGIHPVRLALITLGLVIFLLLIGWQFRCELGFGQCIYQVNEVDILFKKNSKKHDAILAYERAPCDFRVKTELDKAISKNTKSADMGKLWLEWGSRNNCQTSQDEKARHFINSFHYAEASDDKDLADKSIKYLLEAMPRNPEIQLTAAKYYFNQDKIQQAAETYKVAIYYAGGYERISVSDLWIFSKTLRETQKHCENLGILRHLLTRTDNQIEVKIAHDEILSSDKCDIPFDTPIIFEQSSASVLTIPIRLNDTVGNFVIDTGASITTISGSFAKKLRLIPAESQLIELQTANGIAFGFPATINSLWFGQNLWENHMVVVTSGDFGEVDGLLGLDILSQYDITNKGEKWTFVRRRFD